MGFGDQPDVMTKRCQLMRPMKRTTAGLNPNHAGLNLCEECQKLCASQRPIENDLVMLGDPVDLKNGLGQIQTDYGKLH